MVKMAILCYIYLTIIKKNILLPKKNGIFEKCLRSTLKSHGQRSLVHYSPWGGKESDMTERNLQGSMQILFILLLIFLSRILYQSGYS